MSRRRHWPPCPTKYMCFNQTGDISTWGGSSLKLVDKFTYLGSSVSSTEKDINTWLTKAWTAIDRLSVIWKSDLTDKMKRSFFQAAVLLILLYACTTWTLTKQMEKKLDGNNTRMLRAILKSPGGNTPQSTSCTVTYVPSKLDNQTCRTLLKKQRRAHKWCSPMDPLIWPSKSRTTSLNLHTAALWGYGM